MRIGQFCDTFLPVVDGVGRIVHHYARGIGSRGHACLVVTPEQGNPEPPEAEYEVLSFRGVSLPGLRQYRVGFPSLSPAFRRRIARYPLDIVHAHDPFMTGREALRIARGRGIPLVATFHSKYYDDIYQITHSKALSRRITRWIVDFYASCDEVWVVSRATADVLRGYGYRGRIEVVENGTDPKEPDPELVAMASRRYWLGEGPVLFFAGQMNWKKNIRRVLEAVSLLVEAGRDLRLVMAGQGPSEQEIRQLTTALGLDEQVIFTGHITDGRLMDGLYARADLFVFPSLYDNAPMVVREAAALGTPSLLAAGSSAAEAVEDGVTGLIAEDTTEAMAGRIGWALDHPDELRAIGLAARDSIPRPWDQVMSEVLDRYEALVRRTNEAKI